MVDQLLNAIKDKVNELRLQLAGIKERLSVEFRVNLDDILDEATKDGTDTGGITISLRPHEETPGKYW